MHDVGFLKNTWYVAGWAHEFVAGGPPLGLFICGNPVVIYRTAEGKVAAMEDRCLHRFAALSKGRWKARISAACIMG